jgi:hypothetical protein
VIEFISIIVLTFALALIMLGFVTTWLEEGRRKLLGLTLILVGLFAGTGYAFLGSRFSIQFFNRLLVQVYLPGLMAAAFTYTTGVLVGAGLAVSIFLWATGRFRNQTQQTAAAFVVVGIVVVLIATFIAVILSTS